MEVWRVSCVWVIVCGACKHAWGLPTACAAMRGVWT